MPIPNATEATAATENVRDELLNSEHPDGGSKAAWFQSLGYARDRWHELASNLLALAPTCEQFADAGLNLLEVPGDHLPEPVEAVAALGLAMVGQI